jgi:hypothetical protein
VARSKVKDTSVKPDDSNDEEVVLDESIVVDDAALPLGDSFSMMPATIVCDYIFVKLVRSRYLILKKN